MKFVGYAGYYLNF